MFFNWRGTAFDRPAYMYIVNKTDQPFKLHEKKVYSGKLDHNPPDIIKPGETGDFKGMNSGLTGSSGLITYEVDIPDMKSYVSFYWTHPEGSGSSCYYGYSSPFGLFYVTLKNNHDSSQQAAMKQHSLYDFTNGKSTDQQVLTICPGGHAQSITYTVQYSLGHTST